jgi:hypothetical protein
LHHELPGRVDGWEVGTTFSFIGSDRPVIYVSAISVPTAKNLNAVRIKPASSFVYLS